MSKTVAYMRISTAEEREKQTFKSQESAISRWCKEHNTEISDRRIYKDDASGKSFDRPQWQELEADIQDGDTIVFKELSRFTRECDNGFDKYIQLLKRNINLVFIDNPTVSTEYIKLMTDIARQQENRIAKKSLTDTIELLLLVELDRVERERETTVKRIRDGIKASDKKSGRPVGKLDKMSAELEADIKAYINQSITDKTITIADIMKKHNISRNTVKKYIAIIESK